MHHFPNEDGRSIGDNGLEKMFLVCAMPCGCGWLACAEVPSQRAMQKLNLAHDGIARQLQQQAAWNFRTRFIRRHAHNAGPWYISTFVWKSHDTAGLATRAWAWKRSQDAELMELRRGRDALEKRLKDVEEDIARCAATLARIVGL